MDRDEILRVLRAFEAAGLEYVLIGATAMGIHGLVRATEDIDLVIRATPENVERLRAALRAAYGHDPHVEKFRSIEEMNQAPARTADANFDRFLRHCARYWALAPRAYPRGVFKFRSIEDAERARAEHERRPRSRP